MTADELNDGEGGEMIVRTSQHDDPPRTNRVVFIRCSFAWLEWLIRGPFPEGIVSTDAPPDLRILSITPGDGPSAQFMILCQSESFRPVPDGAMIPFRDVTFRFEKPWPHDKDEDNSPAQP